MGWKITFFLGWFIFRGELLNFQGVVCSEFDEFVMDSFLIFIIGMLRYFRVYFAWSRLTDYVVNFAWINVFAESWEDDDFGWIPRMY